MGIEANAVYVVANKIPGLLSIAQNTFTMAWQENASVVSRDRDASEYYSSMFRTMFDLMAGFFGLLIAATPILFRLLIRGDYAAAYNQIPILFVPGGDFAQQFLLGGADGNHQFFFVTADHRRHIPAFHPVRDRGVAI
jgi:hypothetical protein